MSLSMDAKLLFKQGVNKSLISAVDAGDLNGVEECLQAHGLSCIPGWHVGYSVVCYALRNQQPAIAQTLLRNLLQRSTGNGHIAGALFHLAVREGNMNIMEMLLTENIDVNIRNGFGRTPLHTAVINNNLKISQSLVQFGADVDLKDSYDYTAVHYAIIEDRRDIIEMLLKKKVGNIMNVQQAVDREYSTAMDQILRAQYLNNKVKKNSLKYAVCRHNVMSKYVADLFEKYEIRLTTKDANDPEFITAAVEKGYPTIVARLLNVGVDVNKQYESLQFGGKMTLLHMAVLTCQEDMARLLIHNNSNVNVKDSFNNSPIYYAVRSENINIIYLLLANGAQIKEPGLLCAAIEERSTKMFKFLLYYNVDIDSRNSEGRTALHVAVDYYKKLNTPEDHGANHRKDRTNFVELLLMLKPDVNATDKFGATPLHLAASNGALEVCKMLQRSGANVCAEQEDGLTPLHLAITKGHTDVVKFLLRCVSDINTEDAAGDAPLQHKGIAEALINHDADTVETRP